MKRTPKQRLPHVLLIFESSIKACRDKLKGILKYERLYGPWRLYWIEGRIGEQVLECIRDWGGTGIILEASSLLRSDAIRRTVLAASLPTVILDPTEQYLDPQSQFARLSAVYSDGNEVGRVGAEHFLGHRLQQFAFVDEVHQANWSQMRRCAFISRLAEEGYPCHVYGPATQKEKKDWGIEQQRMIAWLQSLPKPIGVMAAMDARARQVLDACHVAGIQVPHEVAVLGVDNDEMICETSHPPLSSIVTDGERGGYVAAEILDGLMSRRIRKKQTATYGVLRVASRRSSEAIQVADPLVQRVLEYIWINNGIGVTIADISRAFSVSRRFLEVRFKKVVGHTVIDEVQRVRLEKIRTLVLESDLSFTEIVRLCGLESESYLGALFKKKYKKTMTQFRKDRG